MLLLGVAIMALYPAVRAPAPPEAPGGFGPAVIIPAGYFIALVGAAGLVIAWMRAARSASGERNCHSAPPELV